MQFKPRESQKYCIERMINEPYLGLFLEMGLGKTVVALTAVNVLINERYSARRVLVIAPKKVAEATWTEELAKWDHLSGLKMSLVLGTKAQRLKALDEDADIYVTNREQTAWLVDLYGSDWPFDMVIVDESSSFKSYKAKRTKKLMSVRPYIRRVTLLSGTPASRGIEDLWSQIYLLDQGERLGRNITAYRRLYFRSLALPFGRVYKPLPGATEAVLSRIRDCCVTMEGLETLDLPELIETDFPVVIEKKNRKLYDELERKMVLNLPDGEITAMSAAALTGKLLQLAGGAVYDEDHNVHVVHDDKLRALYELIESQESEHVIVFYSFRHELERIKDTLSGLNRTIRELKGPDDIKDWNNGDVDILLAHPATTAYGLNLQQGGRWIIWYGITWNYEHYTQANKRLHRSGQEKPVIVHRLVAKGTRDEDVVAALNQKDDCHNYIMTSLQARVDKWKA